LWVAAAEVLTCIYYLLKLYYLSWIDHFPFFTTDPQYRLQEAAAMSAPYQGDSAKKNTHGLTGQNTKGGDGVWGSRTP
jgi:hypothetical protein